MQQPRGLNIVRLVCSDLALVTGEDSYQSRLAHRPYEVYTRSPFVLLPPLPSGFRELEAPRSPLRRGCERTGSLPLDLSAAADPQGVGGRAQAARDSPCPVVHSLDLRLRLAERETRDSETKTLGGTHSQAGPSWGSRPAIERPAEGKTIAPAGARSYCAFVLHATTHPPRRRGT